MAVPVFCCEPRNDLYRMLSPRGGLARFDDPSEAATRLPPGGCLLLLASGYPDQTTPLDEDLLGLAAERGGKVYVEYPGWLPAASVKGPCRGEWERAFVESYDMGPGLERMRILDLHRCSFVKAEALHPLISLGRVAGLNLARYGPPAESHPILFAHPEQRLLVATTKLSHFVTGRYAPIDAWAALWHWILDHLLDRARPVVWTPHVRPTHAPGRKLGRGAAFSAFRRGLEWYMNSGVLVGQTKQGLASAADGNGGLMEGFSSRIDYDGSQPRAAGLRTDCIGEGAGALSMGSLIDRDHPGPRISANLLDFIYYLSPLARGPRGDPDSPSYGLLSWTYTPPSDGVYYGDDNARAMLGTIAGISMLGSDRWDEPLLRCLLANLRTTGANGFRGSRLEEPDLQERGWRYYRDRTILNLAPHYEAYLWACFLWAYRHTGYRPFLSKAENAIRITMEGYPEEWRWTNGIAQERARMLLPLAWLLRVEDTRPHRSWLEEMGRELTRTQMPCGALREELGPAGKGSYGPPRCNGDYGKREATLLQRNGDPISDMLYTTNFAFLGLHEAAAATGASMFVDAEEKLADFLCRIQVRSDKHPELDGAWYRAFDFDRWEYWGSNSDLGWGVWSIESGWTQGWIVSVMGLRRMKTSLWELSANAGIKRFMGKLAGSMLEA